MWSNLEQIFKKYTNKSQSDYQIKHFVREKIDQAFKAYFKKLGKYQEDKFQRDKVAVLRDELRVDEYTAYHITNTLEEMKLDSNGEAIFPTRGKNIPEEQLYKILSYLGVDLYWFFIEPLEASVKFSNTESDFKRDIPTENSVNIPILEKIEDFSSGSYISQNFSIELLRFISKEYIVKNDFHPIFRYPHYAWINVNGEYYLSNLWEQELKEGEFLFFSQKDNKIIFEKIEDLLKFKTENKIQLGRVLAKLTNFKK
ncbi:hypothetical protein JXR93_07355 [bacterium]|nr:hypothetical protein [bacterium]